MREKKSFFVCFLGWGGGGVGWVWCCLLFWVGVFGLVGGVCFGLLFFFVWGCWGGFVLGVSTGGCVGGGGGTCWGVDFLLLLMDRFMGFVCWFVVVGGFFLFREGFCISFFFGMCC